ncbi:MAG: lysylphosphatidylglycerol synthase transmembrane domain-containing protein [Planctomycetota bacterium]|nr:lysylphosphatidylglycerol synthase transmembrane domain-containing protein [Planctomycetota bacterium]
MLPALVILCLVAYFLPWRDVLLVGEAGLAGAFQNDWRGASVHFVPDDLGELQDGSLGAAGRQLTARLAADGGLTVERGEILELGETVSWRPGLPRALAGVSPPRLLGALLALLLGAFLTAMRWWWLLAASGCPARAGPVLRLSFLGLFFNMALPGLTGGDVARAALATREHPERRAEALVSVVVDRLLGLVTLVLLAALVSLFLQGAAGEQLAPLRSPIIGGALLLLGLTWLVLRPGLRRLLGLDRWLGRLPQGRRLLKLDRALSRVGSRHGVLAGALVLSLLNHLCTATAIYGLLGSLGGPGVPVPSWTEVLGIMAVANTISALPLAPAGWGVGEAAFGTLFSLLGFNPTLGVALSVLYRLSATALSLGAGLVLLAPAGRRDRQAWLREAQAAGNSDEAAGARAGADAGGEAEAARRAAD